MLRLFINDCSDLAKHKYSIDFFHLRLNTLKSDVGTYLADLNLVTSEDTGLVLSLPSNKIPSNLSLTLAGDSLAYTQTTVANLMLVGAGDKLISVFFVPNILLYLHKITFVCGHPFLS